ncbi:polysaccharide biosynthesis/export family protein [Xanthobacteraceae bacterium Astr-EGSB]|uniref:polysaccharide biosynthesis/export family protein n=1 Tax=Astrobacterium formosum TaxID=3069710 RepID=UPI0027AFF077|nr:polysaccharide biosynthesis/export family protein [Xanthobacteraceae bacterium Astr-EGSB]
MRRIVLALSLAVLALAGCTRHAPAPRLATAAADLDSFAYGGPNAYAAAGPAERDRAYTLDSGDRLRVVVFGQEGLTSTYAVDAGGAITMPLIGSVKARGLTTSQLSASITARLRQGFIREPSVAVEVEAYRPFFILGEVVLPGQYPYVANMTVETAVAIAGGFAPRAYRDTVELTRPTPGGPARRTVPVATAVRPGDTITVGERWF